MKKTAKVFMIAASVALMTSGMAVAATNDNAPIAIEQPGVAKESKGEKLKSKNPNAFVDLKGHFSAPAVERLLNMGLLQNKGTTDNKFSPDEKLGRKELKQWLKAGLGANVMAGDDSDGTVSRADLALALAAALPPMNTGINGGNLKAPFVDLEGLSTEQRNAIDLLYKLGIMVGDGQGHFAPNAALTKGEGATLVERGITRALGMAKNAEFETMNLSGDLPESVYTMVQENQEMPGIYSVEDNGVRYIMVAGGQVPSGGYSVAVERLAETDGGLFVEAVMNQPEPGKMVTEVISFPYQIVKVTDTTKPVYLN